MNNLASYIDHTLLKPTTTKADILQLCQEAKQYHFASVCVNPCWVKLCAETLQGSGVKLILNMQILCGQQVQQPYFQKD